MRTESLVEHKADVFDLDETQARSLQAAAGARLTVTPTAAGWQVRAGAHVGTIVTADVTLQILPKFRVENLLYLMTWSTGRMRLNHSLVTYEESRSLVPAFAELFVDVLENALVRGVDHQYVETHEALSAVRGRIALPAQRHTAGLPIPIHCTYDDWSIDTWVNRVVRAAAANLLSLSQESHRTSQKLRWLLTMLDGVGRLQESDLLPARQLTRLNEHYEAALRLARLVVQGSSITHHHGELGATSFLVDMNGVYEDFIFGSLRAQMRGRLLVDRQQVTPLGTRGEIPSEPDLVFRRGPDERAIFVADAKYKIAPEGKGRSSDYYQLLAYCTALGLPRGMLIYCDHEGGLPARSVRVVRDGPVLETYRVSLGGDPSQIEAEIARLTDIIDGLSHELTGIESTTVSADPQ